MRAFGGFEGICGVGIQASALEGVFRLQVPEKISGSLFVEAALGLGGKAGHSSSFYARSVKGKHSRGGASGPAEF